MVPPINHRAWRELIAGEDTIASSHFGFNLLLTNSRIYYQKDRSEENLAVLVHHMYDYLAKYEGLYQDELRLIFGTEYTPLFAHHH